MNTLSISSGRLSPVWHVRGVIAALLLGLLTVTTGCVAIVAAGAAGAGVAWVRGTLETTIEHNLDQVYRAAQKTVAELEFAQVSANKSGLDAVLVARTALDKKIEIALKQVGQNTTQVVIRVGVFGDEAMSLAILDRMKREL